MKDLSVGFNYYSGDLEASEQVCVALKADGTVAEFGSAIADSDEPVPAGLDNVVNVASNFVYIFGQPVQYVRWAVKADGSVLNWGTPGHVPVPAGLPKIAKIIPGGTMVFALTKTGKVLNVGNESHAFAANLNLKDLFTEGGLYGITKDGIAVKINEDGTASNLLVNGNAIDHAKEITGCYWGFSVLREDGTVISVNNGVDVTPAGLPKMIDIDHNFGFNGLTATGDIYYWENQNTLHLSGNLEGAFKLVLSHDTYVETDFYLIKSTVGLHLDYPGFYSGTNQNPTLTVLLQNAFPVEKKVKLSSSGSPWVQVPAQVTIPAGETSVTVPLAHQPYNGSEQNNIYDLRAQLGTSIFHREIQLNPIVFNTPYGLVRMTGGETREFTFSGPTHGDFYNNDSGPTILLLTPVPVTFAMPENAVLLDHFDTLAGGEQSFRIVALDSTKSTKGNIVYQLPPASKVLLSFPNLSLRISPKASLEIGVSTPPVLFGNQRGEGTITLSNPAPIGGTDVWIYSDNPNVTVPPDPVHIAQGNTTRTFLIKTEDVDTSETSRISVVMANAASATTLKVNPMRIAQVTATPSTLHGGLTTSVTVKLAGLTRLDMPIIISLSNPALGMAPTSVTVPALSDTVTFVVQTNAVASDTNLKVNATLHGVTKSVTLELNS